MMMGEDKVEEKNKGALIELKIKQKSIGTAKRRTLLKHTMKQKYIGTAESKQETEVNWHCQATVFKHC